MLAMLLIVEAQSFLLLQKRYRLPLQALKLSMEKHTT